MDAINTVEPKHRVGPPRGLSIRGRHFVGPFVVGLLILLAITLSIALQFQTIMRQLDESRTLWPAASVELSHRYAEFDRLVHSASSTTIEGPSKELSKDRASWSAEYAAFRETTQYDRQCPHAINLERFIRSRESVSSQSLTAQTTSTQVDPIPPLPHSEAIDRFLQSEQRRVTAQTNTIGRWTIFSLRLKLPEAFSEGG
ncbi:MAG: hypothetical protein FJ308_16015 [Planctomycetes bacterium]|nr:hypothetical protein [Planctomycetota bacterium]